MYDMGIAFFVMIAVIVIGYREAAGRQRARLRNSRMARAITAAALACAAYASPGPIAAQEPVTAPPPVSVRITAPSRLPEHAILPLPASVVMSRGDSFAVTPATRVNVNTGDEHMARIAHELAALLRGPAPTASGASTRAALDVAVSADTTPAGQVYLTLDGSSLRFGEEGYALAVSR
ncbi:MAG: hypothetical protein M3403_08090, partial [Gemmatimonadota bacterium]|nr:hypothetical protein [Gemmatimonadota bacterium]